MGARVRHRVNNAHDDALAWGSLAMLLPALLLAGLICPLAVAAQPTPIVLTVQLLTVAREPVPGVEVSVVDAASDQRLAAGTTDGRGQARFGAMPPTEIRVRLTGRLADGTALRHTRQDQRGIWVNLPAHDWLMDLRADTDGLVFPDLGLGNAGAPDAGGATAIAAGTLATVYPTAPVATPIPPTATPRSQATSVSAPAARLPDAADTPVSRSMAGPPSDMPGIALLVVLVGVIGAVLWVSARSRG